MRLFILLCVLGLTTNVLAQRENTVSNLVEQAAVFIQENKFDAAIKLQQQALVLQGETFEEKNKDYAILLMGLGDMQLSKTNFDVARNSYEQAKAILDEIDYKEEPLYSKAIESIGLVYQESGNHEKAKPIFQEIYAIRAAIKGHPDYVATLFLLAEAHWELSEPKEAEAYALEGVGLLKNKTAIEEKRMYAKGLGRLGVIYWNIGDYEKGAQYFTENVTILEEIGDKYTEDYCDLKVKYANLCFTTQEYEKALGLLLDTEKILEKIELPNQLLTARCKRGMGLVYTELNKKKLGMQYLEESAAIQKEEFGAYSIEYAYTIATMGQNFLYDMEQYEKAIEAFLTADTIFKRNLGEDYRHAALLQNDLIWCYQGMGDAEGAAARALKKNEIITNRTLRNIAFLSEPEIDNYISSVTGLLKANYYFLDEEHPPKLVEECFNNRLLYKGLRLEHTARLDKILQAAPTELEAIYKEWQATKNKIAIELSKPASEQSIATNLQAQAEELEKILNRNLNGFEDAIKVIKWQDIQGKLQAGEIVIDFVRVHLEKWDGYGYAAFLLKADQASPEIITLYKESELVNFKAARQLYKHESDKSLYQLIWKQLEPHLSGVSKVYYSSEGVIDFLNLGAIPINTSEIVADHYQLYNLGNIKQLALSTSNSIPKPSDALLFGGIVYDENRVIEETQNEELQIQKSSPRSISMDTTFRNLRGKDWQYLEWTKKEVDAIEKILSTKSIATTSYKGTAATETAFKTIGTNSPSPSILHLATHGYFFPHPEEEAQTTGFSTSSNPFIRSGLILANANHAWQGNVVENGEEDGILTAYEIAQMNLKNTELVVLSACDTGLGDESIFEGIHGLRRAFKIAGAKYVMMSLWSVDDKKTYEFMTEFYDLWQNKGNSIPEAHRLTQNKMRKRYALPFNPSAWAGFILVD